MVKKWKKAENRKLAIAQAAKITKRIRDKRDAHDVPMPSAGQSFAHIKNKHKRSQMVNLMKREQKRVKSKIRRDKQAAEARGEKVERGHEQRTIEKMREPDETIVPDEDSEVEAAEAFDEFEKYFSGNSKPKILMTTQKKPSARLFDLLKELIHVLPNTFYYPRKDFEFKKVCEFAANRSSTDVMLFHEKAKVIQGVYMCHLPKGPTSYWRLTILKLSRD